MALTPQRKLFVQHFITGGLKNGAQAAIDAGYSKKNARQQAAFLLTIPDIQKEIQRYLDKRALTAEQTLEAMSDMARSTLDDFLTLPGTFPYIDLVKARERGKLHLVKKVKVRGDGGLEIELYDKQQALAYLGKHHGLWKDGVQIDVNIDLVVKVVQAAKAAGIHASDLFNDILVEIDGIKQDSGAANGSAPDTANQ